MAVTNADLEPSRSKTDLSSKTGAFLMVLTILLGLFCFILCLIAEATRSEVTWMNTGGKEKDAKSECVYNGNGKVPLLCAASAFVGLAIAMVMQHTYMLIAISNSERNLLSKMDLKTVLIGQFQQENGKDQWRKGCNLQ